MDYDQKLFGLTKVGVLFVLQVPICRWKTIYLECSNSSHIYHFAYASSQYYTTFYSSMRSSASYDVPHCWAHDS